MTALFLINILNFWTFQIFILLKISNKASLNYIIDKELVTNI